MFDRKIIFEDIEWAEAAKFISAPDDVAYKVGELEVKALMAFDRPISDDCGRLMFFVIPISYVHCSK